MYKGLFHVSVLVPYATRLEQELLLFREGAGWACVVKQASDELSRKNERFAGVVWRCFSEESNLHLHPPLS